MTLENDVFESKIAGEFEKWITDPTKTSKECPPPFSTVFYSAFMDCLLAAVEDSNLYAFFLNSSLCIVAGTVRMSQCLAQNISCTFDIILLDIVTSRKNTKLSFGYCRQFLPS